MAAAIDLRLLLSFGLLLSALATVPGGAAKPCSDGPDVDCHASVGNCEVDAGANVITTTSAGAAADCRFGSMTRCHAEAAVGPHVTDPHVERWCAF